MWALLACVFVVSAQSGEKTFSPRRTSPDTINDHIDTTESFPESFISLHLRVASDSNFTAIDESLVAPVSNATKLPSFRIRDHHHPIKLQGLGGFRWPYFLHLHKAGGTTVCHLARSVNGMNAPIRNCDLPGDSPHHLEEGLAGDGNIGLSCEARANYLRQNCIQFFAVERWLDASMCPDRFLYMTVLREPVSRIESQCRYNHIQPADAIRWLTKTTCLKKCNGKDEDTRVTASTAVVDNFYVRSFGGPEVFHRPKGGVTTSDFDEAKKRLLLFEVVLVLEEFKAGFVQIEQLLGWEAPISEKEAHQNSGKGDSSIIFTTDQRQILVKKNRLDIDLYAFAVDRSRAISAAILQDKSSRRLSSAQSSKLGLSETRSIVAGAGKATIYRRGHADHRARRLLAPKKELDLPQTPPFMTWKEANAARTTNSERSSCQTRFLAYEKKTKLEITREAAALKKKRKKKKEGHNKKAGSG